MKTIHYIIISPVRNEEQFLRLTIASMAAQTVLPLKWVLVNDGSTDGTGALIEKAAGDYSWIVPVNRADRGRREAGGGVMEAFYDGYERIKDLERDFIIKLDGDLSFGEDYFEQCFRRFETEPRLGIAGGTICQSGNGQPEPESKIDPRFHVRGATKIYRQSCWREIGGLYRAPGWDTIDEVKAQMLGWRTQTFPDLILIHHRVAGGAYGSWSNWHKNGRANYFAGYHPLFMLVKCLRRFFSPPYGTAACGLLAGFFSGYLKKMPRVNDPDLVRYFRRQQMNRLFLKENLWQQAIPAVAENGGNGLERENSRK